MASGKQPYAQFPGDKIFENTATTVGAAGGATALPATPLGYAIVEIAGQAVKIPYYKP